MAGKGGMTTFLVISGFGILGILGLLGWMVFSGGLAQQTIVPTTTEQKAQVEETAKIVSQGLRTGTASTVNSRLYDMQSAATSQVATNITIEEWNGEGVGVGDMRLIEDGTLTSATADTATGTSIGKTLYMCGGVGTHLSQAQTGTAYYGRTENCKTLKVDEETENTRLDVDLATHTVSLSCYDDSVVQGNATASTDAVDRSHGCGVLIGAAQVISLDYLRVEVNTTDRAFNFKGIGFNMSSPTDIEDVEAGGSSVAFEGFTTIPSNTMWKESSVPKRLTINGHNVKFWFELEKPVLLQEWDVVKTAPVSLDADADNPAELDQIYFVDESLFREAGGQQRIKSGVQTDEETPRNIGAPDFYLPLNIR